MAAPATPANQKAQPPAFNPNSSPRQRFQSVPAWIGTHRQLVDSEPFQRAVDFALLQYQQQVSAKIIDANGAGAAGLKMQGVVEFLAVLRNLSETAIPTPRRPDDNLTHH